MVIRGGLAFRLRGAQSVMSAQRRGANCHHGRSLAAYANLPMFFNVFRYSHGKGFYQNR